MIEPHVVAGFLLFVGTYCSLVIWVCLKHGG